jgi:integrase
MDSVEREGISVRILSGNKGADGLNVINSSCSATFIGPNTILTAAHCLYAKDIVYLVKEFFKTDSMGKKSLYSIRQKPVLSWKTMPGYVNNNKTFTGIAPIVNDIALIQVSQEDGISSWAEISSSGPSLCDEVNWIGYGSTSHQDNRALGLRKIGKNEIETIEHESGRSVIMFQSRSEGETPNESQSGSGDSGAGLFNSNGELVGVVNASTKNAIKFYDNDEKDPMYQKYDQAVQTVLDYFRQQDFSRTPCKDFKRASREFRKYLQYQEAEYSPELAKAWLGVCRKKFSKWKFQIFRRALTLVEEVVRTGAVLALAFRYDRKPVLHVPACYESLLDSYLFERRRDGNQPSTLCMDAHACVRFLVFLEDQGITNLDGLSPQTIKDYHAQARHGTAAGKNAYTCRIRGFVRFLARKKLVPETLECAFTSDKAAHVGIVTSLSADQVATVREYSSASSTPSELRNAAIALLVLRMGFRSSDVCNLRLSDISWNDRTIALVQQKTGVPLTLPFPVDVGNMLARYINEGRPECIVPTVFVSLYHPYRKLQSSRCYRASMAILGEKASPNDIRGMHLLRRTFASRLLEAGNAVSIISSALGHTQEETVDAYLATDGQRMRQCSIGLTGIEFRKTFA